MGRTHGYGNGPGVTGTLREPLPGKTCMLNRPATSLRRTTAVACLLLAAMAVPAGAVKETESIRDARDRREAARNEAASAAEALELVAAEDDQVSDALHALDDAVSLQEARITAARQAIEAAESEATLRWVQADQVAAEVVELRRRIQELAIDVYISRMRPGILLESGDLTLGIRRSAILNAVTGDRGDLVDRLRDIARSADDAIADAQVRQRELESSILVLDRRIAAKEDVKHELDERIRAYEAEIRQFERDQYVMAILIENLIADELRKSAPDLTKESGQGFIMPIEGRLGSGFGPRKHPIFGTMRQHNGVDIGCVRSGRPRPARSSSPVGRTATETWS